MKTGFVLAVLAVLMFSAAAWAEGAPPPQQSGKMESDQQEEKLSDKDMLSRANGHVKKMRDIVTRLLEILEDARKEKDVVKINCVNEKLTASKALLRIAEQADVGLQEAVVKKETETARHEFEKVSIANQKIQMLKTEAEGCTGQLTYTGETKTEIEEPKDTKPVDDIVNRPPMAKPKNPNDITPFQPPDRPPELCTGS